MSYLDLAPMLPWSEEAEQSVIGALLMDCQAAFERAQPLQARHFFDSRHATIYMAVERMVTKKLPVDVITVWEELKDDCKSEEVGDMTYLSALSQAVPSAYSVNRYAAIVREKAGRRALLETADKALEVASEPGGDLTSKLDEITSLFSTLQRQTLTKVPKSMAEVAVERTAHYEALQAGKAVAGWPTNIPRLDLLLNGGLRPGGLYIEAARPSVGKSSLAQWLGMVMAKSGLKVLFLSLEMTCEELADRAVSSSGRIDYSALQTGRMSNEHWSRAVDALDAVELKNFYVDDQAGITLTDIRAKAKQVPGLNVLILDYLQLCAGSGVKDANRNSEIEQISRGLKTLAKELGIAVIALSQLNRQVEQRTNKRPMLSDLRDSGAIEQDADAVIFLWPVRELPNGVRLIGLGLDKNRQGRCGEVALHFEGAVQRWTESSESVHTTPAPGRSRGMGYDD